ncbi:MULTISPECIES: peptidoglycan-binding domain-containing protein [unclassified Coleofasciculus]|uniref:peptidoglycan-binding domain-containing protein n=1 Tax=Cyanophyceae TaxID=3028117 RepID=UPI0018EFAA6E|nr:MULTISPECIES: peptidoglycan-binding domain-containing protein [unclassified Coleofasciculus]
MTAKSFKSTIKSLSILSAVASLPLLLNGMSANAAGISASQINPEIEEMPIDMHGGSYEQPTRQAQLIPDPTGRNEGPTVPAENIAPAKFNPLARYSPSPAPMLKSGSQGAVVTEVQTVLKDRGLYKGGIDGVYGSQTRSAVIAFQQSRNLSPDGIVGPRTWEAMIAA